MYLQGRTVTLLGPQPATTEAPTSTSTSSSTSATETLTRFEHTILSPVPTTTSTSVPSNTAAAKSVSNEKSVNKGPIIGGVIGGVIFITLAAVLLWIVLRRRRTRQMDFMGQGFSPLVGGPANGSEKFAMDNSPDLGESGERRSGGVFGPFGGYHKTPSVAARDANRSLDIEDPTDAPIPDSEKSSLVAPALEEHPALHPLPGVSVTTPTYYPGPQHPAYNTLPSQQGRHPTHVTLPTASQQAAIISERSPEIPDFEFSPVELLPEDDFANMDSVPLTPQAELAAYPSPPKSIASQLSQLKRHSTPPRNRPRRTSTPPRMSLPLDRLTPPPSGPLPPRPKLHRKSHTSELSISTLNRKPTPRRTRPRNVTYPSPTAGGRPELPASYPPVFVARTPRGKNPNPAFHHISLPSPQEPPSASSIRRNESTATSYSIPIGLGVEQKQETKQEMKEQNNNWPIHNHPVTSDAHHLREQPSYVSALSVARDLQNASAVSALTTSSSVPPIPEAEIETMPRLKHNHSMEWEHPKSAQKQHHVMSWQNYSAAGSPIAEADDREPQTSISTATTEVSPMFSPPTHSEKNYTVVSPMLSPPAPGQAGYKGWHHYSYDGEPATPQIGMAERLSIKVGLTPMIGNKLFSQKSLQKREQERKELMGQYGDLSVQPLNPERRRNGRKATY